MNIIKIVDVKGKLKAQVLGTDYYARFPRHLREENKLFVVEEIGNLGTHMVAKGEIKPLDNEVLWSEAVKEHLALFNEMPTEFRTDDVIIEVLKKTDDKDLYRSIAQTAKYKSNKDAINQLTKRKVLMATL